MSLFQDGIVSPCSLPLSGLSPNYPQICMYRFNTYIWSKHGIWGSQSFIHTHSICCESKKTCSGFLKCQKSSWVMFILNMEDQVNNQHFCNTDLMKIPASPSGCNWWAPGFLVFVPDSAWLIPWFFLWVNSLHKATKQFLYERDDLPSMLKPN